MKLTAWLIVLPLLPLATQAQRQPGRWQLGAEVNQFTFQKIATGRTTYAGLITPSVGYYLGRSLVISLGLPLGISTNKNSLIPLEESRTKVGVSSAVRYYLGPSNLKPFVSLAYNYVWNQNTYKILSDTYTATDHSTLVIPSIGLAYSLSAKLTIATSLNYLMTTNESTSLSIPSTRSHLDVDRPNDKSLSLGIGLQLMLGK